MGMRFVERLILGRTSESLRVRCPAKVNLFLRIRGKREDGYHELQNVMQTVTLFDEMKVRLRKRGVRLTCSHAELARHPEENLAFRAAELFFGKGYGSGGAHIELRKNIPIGAGLGGGSSDGACCLLALNELFGARLSEDALRRQAAELGSDVPFFISGGTALCTGRGEIVTQLRQAPRFAGILAFPPQGLSTAEVYGSLSEMDFGGPDVETMIRAIDEGNLQKVCGGLFNGLERAVLAKAPQIVEWRKNLEEAGSMGTILCGSGPTLLSIFQRAADSKVALSRLRRGTFADKVSVVTVRAF